MKRIAFKTLGCRLNQYETDALASQFFEHGYRIVNFDDDADVVIVNTCTVTNQSDSKSSQTIKQAISKHPDALVLVAGCMVNNYGEKLKNKFDRVAWFIDNKHKSSVFNMVDSYFKGEILHPEDFEGSLFNFETAKKTFHTRSWIKIQDGCNNFCTYCIIPKVRGRAVSRPLNDVLDNIRQVVDFGYKEVVLTGVNIGRYYESGNNFEDLVEKILDLPGDFRLRIGSIEPEGFGDKLFDLFSHPKLTPHLHLCIQSGSDRILKLMHRMYTVKDFTQTVEKIRKRYPDFNFTTDVIVGFPGETEADFKETVAIVRKLNFGHVHTFKFSLRTGTRAEKLPERIPEITKTKRSEVLHRTASEEKRKYRLRMLGKKQKVLIEKIKNGIAYGYGEHYIPVRFEVKNDNVNRFAEVMLAELPEGDDPVFNGAISREDER